MNPTTYADLVKLLSVDSVLKDPDECKAYGSDWTKTPGQAGLVVLPRSTEEVAKVLKYCSENKIPVVPSGGRTGLAGGAVAQSNHLVLSLSRMNKMHEIDLSGLTLRVQTGVTTQAVHEFTADAGLTWPIDLAAKGTSQIGGNLSTNAGGLRVIRWGMARKWVVGLQAVTMDGEIIELNRGLEKNNTGYDLMQLLLGSEGTLAVLTEATLKLARLGNPKNISVLFFPFPSVESIVTFFEEARRGPFSINAFEFFSAKCLNVVTTRLKRENRMKTPGAFYALMEIESPDSEGVEKWLSGILEKGLVEDGLLASTGEEKKAVWGLREGITESLQMTPPVKKYDVSVAVKKMTAFLAEVEQTLKEGKYQIDLFLFGHLGDGSPHLNLLRPENSTEAAFLADCDRFEKTLFQLLKKHGGSVSSEHGVGMLKRHWVSFSRTATELRLFREIKKAFDPQGLLNPGKVIPD